MIRKEVTYRDHTPPIAMYATYAVPVPVPGRRFSFGDDDGERDRGGDVLLPLAVGALAAVGIACVVSCARKTAPAGRMPSGCVPSTCVPSTCAEPFEMLAAGARVVRRRNVSAVSTVMTVAGRRLYPNDKKAYYTLGGLLSLRAGEIFMMLCRRAGRYNPHAEAKLQHTVLLAALKRRSDPDSNALIDSLENGLWALSSSGQVVRMPPTFERSARNVATMGSIQSGTPVVGTLMTAGRSPRGWIQLASKPVTRSTGSAKSPKARFRI